MRFGKLINGELVFAPNTMVDKMELYQMGYMPVVEKPMPVDSEYFVYECDWVVEDKKLVQVWSVVSDIRPGYMKREEAYETRKCVSYEGELYTVDEANKLVTNYMCEGRDMSELISLIAAAKNEIRDEFPDTN